MPKTLVGGFQSAQGVSLAGAKLTLKLSQEATITSGPNAGQVAPITINIFLDSNGHIPTGTTVYGEDELTPSGTYYTAELWINRIERAYGPQKWQIAGSSPVNINNFPPDQPLNPIVNVIGGNVTISGIPNPGQVLVATSTTTADWEDGVPAPAPFTQITTGTNTTAGMTVGSGATLTHSGTGVIDATAVGGIPILPGLAASTQGKIPISQGDGTAIFADPLVQGLVAEGASLSAINPVAIGGKDGSGNNKYVALDSSGRITVNVNGTIPVTLASTTITGNVAVTGTFWQATQPVSIAGTVTTAFSAPQHVIVDSGGGGGTQYADNAASGSTPTGTLASGWDSGNSKVRALKVDASQNLNVNVQAATLGTVTVSGPLTDAQLRASAVPVSLASTTITGSVAVTGTFWQATQPISGAVSFTAPQHVIVDSATLGTVTVSGSVTANIGTTGGLALDASVTGLQVAQGSTTSGQNGDLVQGAVTTSAPTYTTAKTNPLSLQTDGSLRTAVTNTVTVSGTVAVTQSTSPWVVSNGGTFAVQAACTQSTSPWVVSLASTTVTGTVAVTQSTSPWVVSGTVGISNSFALDASVTGLQVAQGSTTSGQNGELVQSATTASAPTYTTAKTNPLSTDTSGNLRVSLKDSPANTNKFLVTADPITFASAQSVNATLSAETTKVIGTVNVASSQTIAVTNTGTFAVQSAATLSAETTKVIGTVNIAGSQTIAVTNTGTFAVQAAQGTAAASTAPWYTRPGAPTTGNWTVASISFSSSGDNTVVSHTSAQTIRVMRIFLVNSDASTASNYTIKDSTPTSFSGAFRLASGGSFSADSDGEPLFVTASAKDFIINSSAAVQTSGTIWYTTS